MWSSEFAPQTLKEFLGNAEAVEKILLWLKRWPNVEKPSLLVHGPPGTGKTTALRLVSKESGRALIENTAADLRSASELRDLSPAVQQKTLFFKGRLLIFDEIDSLSVADRGAVPELVKLVKSSRDPVIFVATDAYEPKIKPLREISSLIKFEKPSALEIEALLEKISKTKGIEIDGKAVGAVAREAAGDIKAAINDLEMISRARSRVTADDAKILAGRDIERSIFELLTSVFGVGDARSAVEAMDTSEEPRETVALWIRENLPAIYSNPKDLAAAYRALSRSDIFSARVARQQYWRLEAIASQILAAGVATSKSKKYPPSRFQYPWRIIRLAQTKAMRTADNAVLEKLAPRVHCSKAAARIYLPLLNIMRENAPETWKEVSAAIGAE